MTADLSTPLIFARQDQLQNALRSPHLVACCNEAETRGHKGFVPLYTEAQMSERVAAERERCAKLCRETAEDYRKHAEQRCLDPFMATRFVTYATALDDMANSLTAAASTPY